MAPHTRRGPKGLGRPIGFHPPEYKGGARRAPPTGQRKAPHFLLFEIFFSLIFSSSERTSAPIDPIFRPSGFSWGWESNYSRSRAEIFS